MENKLCRECKYYLKHYVISGSRFLPVLSGHCINTKPSGHFRKTDTPCEYWKESTAAKEEIKNTVFITLEKISERIDEIAQILKLNE